MIQHSKPRALGAATKLVKDAHGNLHRVPAHTMAPPRKRGGLAEWLAAKGHRVAGLDAANATGDAA